MRHKILNISPQILIDICKEGTENVRIIKDALPKDAKYIYAFTDDTLGYGRVGLVIESESYSELKDGELLERINGPIFERVDLK